jgi:hypothetical protein
MRLTSNLNIFCKTILAIQKDIVGPSVKSALVCVTRHSRYPQSDATLVLVITGGRGLRSGMVTGGLRYDHPARPQGQEWQARYTPDPRRRITRIGGQLRRDQGRQATFVFASERGSPFKTDALNRPRLGEKAKLGFPHPRPYAAAIHAVTPWPMRATIRGLFRTGLVTGQSSILSATRN